MQKNLLFLIFIDIWNLFFKLTIIHFVIPEVMFLNNKLLL